MSKKLSFIILAIAVVILGAYYFQTNKVKDLQNVEMLPTDQQKPPIEWQTYTNYRFGYTIGYPKDWHEGEESDNGDGISLYKNEDNEILVYGTLHPSSFSTQNTPAEREVFVLSNRIEATKLKLKDEEGKIRYIVFFDDSDKQYVFFAKVSEDFFKDNEPLLQEVAKSFKRIKGAEDE